MSAPPPSYPGVSNPAYNPEFTTEKYKQNYPSPHKDYPPPPPPQQNYPPPPQHNYPPPQQDYPPPQQPRQPYPQGPPPGVQGPYPAVQSTQQHNVVVNQPGPVIIQSLHFSESPTTMTCPHCQAHITTSTHYQTGSHTWMICLIICAAGLFCELLWLGCCLIPFCMNSMKDVIHECPNCHKEVGRLRRNF